MNRTLRKWALPFAQFLIFVYIFVRPNEWLPTVEAQGQRPLEPGLSPPRQKIRNTLGGVYSQNTTLFFRNSPFFVENDVVVMSGATLRIETGVQMYFATGVGLKIYGTLEAIGNEFAHIQMLPYQEQLNYDEKMPEFRLIDGPSVRQGRLQMRFRDRWRSVCTMVTNWTSIDTGTACRSMGYSDGGFWKWYLRNNDTYPLVMPQPDCRSGARNLWECDGFSDASRIRMSENLCQGEDDLGLYCWGPPTFTGWAKHWKGIQMFSSPFGYVPNDPNYVSAQRESHSRLEFLDILFAGYDGYTRNVTAALYIEGVPPIMNGLRVEKSARDGIHLYEPSAPILIANSTISGNRGHGIVVENTTDGRLFVNWTRIEGNYGDGIWYRQQFLGDGVVEFGSPGRYKRQISFYDHERPRVEMCEEHGVPENLFFPHKIRAHLRNQSTIDSIQPIPCWMTVKLPPKLDYVYTLQFLSVVNRNPERLRSKTELVICDGNSTFSNLCQIERHRVPIRHGILPQSLPVQSTGNPIFIGLEHDLGPTSNGHVFGDVDLIFKIHASVPHKAFYGLNITNTLINNNTGNGIKAVDIRDRFALSNVTVDGNEGVAGVMVAGGAADIWVNDTSMSNNWGDGMNVSYSGGAVNLNTSRLMNNRWRGFAFHLNTSLPFYALRHEVVLKGRPSNNRFYPEMLITGNLWGGVLIGNYCIPASTGFQPKILLNWLHMEHNHYHPHIEIFSCQSEGMAQTFVDVTGNHVLFGTGMGFRMEPTVNTHLVLNSNRFHNLSNSAILIRNSRHPWLRPLPSYVEIYKSDVKFNEGNEFVVSVGLNEDAPNQMLKFAQLNEVRTNKVFNPYPHLKPRSSPFAVFVVSSSNVIIQNNCFGNPQADYEIATSLMEHAKVIDASQNSWGDRDVRNFLHRIFDQFNRYSLARINIDPYSAVCNVIQPVKTGIQENYRPFRHENQPFVIGGTIYENNDLEPGKYTVIDDLHIMPGARLTLSPGTELEFMDGIGMLVQGELVRSDHSIPNNNIRFTSRPFQLPKVNNVRLVDDWGNEDVLAGRLEVKVDDQWGTVCNRSWTAHLAQLTCNQLGLTMDPQYFENWRIFVGAGDLPMLLDNIRCEEREYDITKCRHDGSLHNIRSSCRPTEVVGLRCAPPFWAGVRYSLYASPPSITGQTTMTHWLIEKAGLFDFRSSTFSPALQIDWNYHTFHNLTIRDNYGDGLYVVYNDLTKKPAIRYSTFSGNRLNGIKMSSNGITIEQVTMRDNQNAGFRYDPQISASLQRDIVSWLDGSLQPDLTANNVFLIPNRNLTRLRLVESQLNHRIFLRAALTSECPLNPMLPCEFETQLEAEGYEYGMASKLVVQLVNRANNESDEDAVIIDQQSRKRWSVRQNPIQFPIMSAGRHLTIRYTRSYGAPKLVLLVLFLDAQEYLDRFIHVYESVVDNNQYGISASHYSNLTFSDGAVLNRWSEEKIWFQKVNFTRNSEAVVWIHSPQHAVPEGTPLAEITWHIDNCSLHHNVGPVIDTHRDLFVSANIFHWNFWSNTFENNTNSGVNVLLPDTYDLLAPKTHSFWMTENRFQNNDNFYVHLGGYYTFANISSNNFTDNYAFPLSGILELSGMEKNLILERNRFFNNWGHWMIKIQTDSQSLRTGGHDVPSFIQYNYFQFNRFISSIEDYVDMDPRSYTVGVFGSQKVDIHYNRLKNPLMDFEIVAGCTPQIVGLDVMNITYNWFGVANEAEVAQRVFDLDDWNRFTIGNFTPFFVSEEQFLNFWWDPKRGQVSHAQLGEPNPLDLKGRIYESKTLKLDPERWYPFPYHYRPFRPIRVTRDVTIMPGATVTIERNVEIHVAPNVRILVLGHLIADGTLWQPIRFKPLNLTELAEEEGLISTRYKRSATFLRPRKRRSDTQWRHLSFLRRQKRSNPRSRLIVDPVFRQFPSLRRDDPFFQEFDVRLSKNGTRPGRSGFLELYNATTGEIVPSCDRQFTVRNAQVVCRELGYKTQNAYHWITPRYDYNPQIRLVKTYMEPRECRGHEPRLDKCPLRLAANDSMWMCMDTLYFNYIHCGEDRMLNEDYGEPFGGITFARRDLELVKEPGEDQSVLRFVEIVGGGRSHNDSIAGAALQIIRRSPIMENVNVTNSSMHGLQIISPRANIVLMRLNVSQNSGLALNILSTNLQAASANSPVPQGPITIPYHVVGMLDLCAAGKSLTVTNRILVYYKYDSKPVDCVKVFHSGNGRNLGFRFLQVNLYGDSNPLGRTDALSIYEDGTFSVTSRIGRFTRDSNFAHIVLPTRSSTLGFHLRATAADGEYGFIGEVSTLPSTPDGRNVEEVAIRNSRFESNDRGAVQYRNCGEVGPNIIMEQCLADRNGYFLFGNISTSAQAMELHLHNTMLLLFRANALHDNRGGLLLTAESSSAVARTDAVIKNCAFTMNSNSTTLAFLGNNYQRITLLNNVICRNYALYYDTVLANQMSVNFTRNLFCNNTCTHVVDTQGHSRIATDSQFFDNNFFENNLALGHGNQYNEAYGYLGQIENDEFRRRPKREIEEKKTEPQTRKRRQVLNQRGINFDWWTHVDAETGRYRCTIAAGSANQKFKRNVFNDPLNDCELTTSVETPFDTGIIDARENYWGYPGTPGVASAKIRDHADYDYLIRVDFEPVLESNTSLVEGDCPPGWFQIGHEEFKSCFLFVGASMTYSSAVRFCEEMDAFMPILRADDSRQAELAARVDAFGQRFVTEIERYNSFGHSYDIPIWIASVVLPSNQCGWMSSRTGVVGEQNCNNLLPFICEKGTKPYQEPVLWRRDIILMVSLLLLLLCIVALLIVCAYLKSQRRAEHFHKKKQFYRESIRHSRGRLGTGTAPTALGAARPSNPDIFDAMNPDSTLGAVASSLQKPKNKRRPKASTKTSSTDSSCSTCGPSGSSPTDRTYSSLPTTAATSETPPPAYVPPGKDGKNFGRNSVSLNPNPYEGTFRSSTSCTSTASTCRVGTQPNGTYEDMSASFVSSTSTCCASRSTNGCSTCSASNDSHSLLETDLSRDSALPTGSSFMDSTYEDGRSVSSESTVTAERPLLRTNAIDTLRTPLSSSRKSIASASTAATVLQVSNRTDSTSRTPVARGNAADFFRGSGRPQSRNRPTAAPPPPLTATSSRSNPNLFVPSSPQSYGVPRLEDMPLSAAPLSRRESTRSFHELPAAQMPASSAAMARSQSITPQRRPQPQSLSQVLHRGIIPVAQTVLQRPSAVPPPAPYVNIVPGSQRPPQPPTTAARISQQHRPGRLPSTEDDRWTPLETSM